MHAHCLKVLAACYAKSPHLELQVSRDTFKDRKPGDGPAEAELLSPRTQGSPSGECKTIEDVSRTPDGMRSGSLAALKSQLAAARVQGERQTFRDRPPLQRLAPRAHASQHRPVPDAACRRQELHMLMVGPHE